MSTPPNFAAFIDPNTPHGVRHQSQTGYSPRRLLAGAQPSPNGISPERDGQRRPAFGSRASHHRTAGTGKDDKRRGDRIRIRRQGMMDPVARQLAHFHGNDHYSRKRLYVFLSGGALT